MFCGKKQAKNFCDQNLMQDKLQIDQILKKIINICTIKTSNKGGTGNPARRCRLSFYYFKSDFSNKCFYLITIFFTNAMLMTKPLQCLTSYKAEIQDAQHFHPMLQLNCVFLYKNYKCQCYEYQWYFGAKNLTGWEWMSGRVGEFEWPFCVIGLPLASREKNSLKKFYLATGLNQACI